MAPIEPFSGEISPHTLFGDYPMEGTPAQSMRYSSGPERRLPRHHFWLWSGSMLLAAMQCLA